MESVSAFLLIWFSYGQLSLKTLEVVIWLMFCGDLKSSEQRTFLVYWTIKCVVKQMFHSERFPGCLASIYVAWIIHQGLGHLSYQSVCRVTSTSISLFFFFPLSLSRSISLQCHNYTLYAHLFDSHFGCFLSLSAFFLPKARCKFSAPAWTTASWGHSTAELVRNQRLVTALGGTSRHRRYKICC